MTFPNLPVHQQAIEAFCQQVLKQFNPECIILHGSVARGTHTKDSDIDILVVGGQLPNNFFTRIYELNKLRAGKTPIEVIGYTLIEWEQMMGNLHLTALEALQWGIPLYGETIFSAWQAQLKQLKDAGLKRGKTSWRVPATLNIPIP